MRHYSIIKYLYTSIKQNIADHYRNIHNLYYCFDLICLHYIPAWEEEGKSFNFEPSQTNPPSPFMSDSALECSWAQSEGEQGEGEIGGLARVKSDNRWKSHRPFD